MDISVQLLSFVEWPSDKHGATVDEITEEKDPKTDNRVPFVGSHAAVTTIVSWPTKKDESGNQTLLERLNDAMTRGTDAIVLGLVLSELEEI